MSYTFVPTGNSIQDLYRRLEQFYGSLPYLTAAQENNDPDLFIRWFEKLILVDRRSMYINVLNGSIKVPEVHANYVYYRLQGFRYDEELKEVLGIGGAS